MSDKTVTGLQTVQKLSAEGASKVAEGAGVVGDLAMEKAVLAGELAKKGYTEGIEFYEEHQHEVQSVGAAVLVLDLVKAVLGSPAPVRPLSVLFLLCARLPCSFVMHAKKRGWRELCLEARSVLQMSGEAAKLACNQSKNMRSTRQREHAQEHHAHVLSCTCSLCALIL